MESQDKKLTHSESLEIIAEAISRTKIDYRDNSFYFLLWGWLVALASFAFFVLHHFTGIKLYFIPFPVAAIAGIITTTAHYIKHKSIASTESYLTFYLSRLWLVLGLSFIMVVFINVSQNHTPFTYTLIIGGIGTLVSGLVMRFKPMIWGGVCFLLSAILSIYIPEGYTVLLHGIAVITGYLIPGYLLKHSNK